MSNFTFVVHNVAVISIAFGVNTIAYTLKEILSVMKRGKS